ncbi:MAG: hypothetical protein WD749_02745 [Phycisphaerales bacterium]
MRRTATIAAILLAGSPSAAQVAVPAQPAPPPARQQRPRPPEASIPGLEDTDFTVRRAPLRREGTFLLRQRGSMVRLPGGERAIIFHPDQTGRAERPMLLIPCANLERMEQIAADRPTPPVFDISGQVFAYRGVNYLLPTAFPMVQPGPGTPPPSPAGTEPPGEPAGTPAPPAGGAPATDTDIPVQDLIRQLEGQRERPRTIDAGLPAPPVRTGESHRQGAAGSPGAAAATDGSRPPIAEGRVITRRRARMVREGGGWALAFDSGPEGDRSLDRPMLVAPCLNLERMEAWAASRGDAMQLEVSGHILAYEGRNSVIPTMFRVYPASDLEPRQ